MIIVMDMMMENVTFYKTQISLLRIIGSGAFSTVYLGKIPSQPDGELLSVKVPKDTSQSDVSREMRRMVPLNHRNVINLIGIAIGCTGRRREDHLDWLLMEYAGKGDLVRFMQRRHNSQMALDERLWTYISIGLAQGMKYLHEKLIVHCDLHTENCFVNRNNVAKIGDFGLSYRLSLEEEAELLLQRSFGELGRPKNISFELISGPRWKAPEFIPGTNFKPLHLRPGDVYAYGLVLYEFWSDGVVPFASLKDNNEVSELIVDGRNPMDFDPIQTPPFIAEIMDECFKYAPNNRPKFATIVQKLKENQILLGYKSASN